MMDRAKAEHIMEASLAYRIRRSHWIVNAFFFVAAPLISAIIMPIAFLWFAVMAAFSGVREAFEDGDLFLGTFKPCWHHKNEKLEQKIAEARAFLAATDEKKEG